MEKKLLGSQSEVLARAVQNAEMARAEMNRIFEMILDEHGIVKKDFQLWKFSKDLKIIFNDEPPKPPKDKGKKNEKV